MKEEQTTMTEVVDAEVINEVQAEKMEFRLINPTEDGFLRVIEWNKMELEAAVRQKVDIYKNIVYTEDNIKQAKADRAELNKLTKVIEECRKRVKKIINEPYYAFETELKEILALIQEPVGIIDKQVKTFENEQKEEKKKSIKSFYDEIIGDLVAILPFEKVFDNKYLNKSYKLTMAQSDIEAKIEKVRIDLETIDSLESKYKLNAKDVYIKTLELSKALAENKRLSELEEKLEAEKKHKAEENAEKKRLVKEQQKVKILEEQKKAEQEVVIKQQENTSIQNIKQQTIEQQEVQQKYYQIKFYAKGTRVQLEKLVQYMNDNDIEYGKIKESRQNN